MGSFKFLVQKIPFKKQSFQCRKELNLSLKIMVYKQNINKFNLNLI